MINIAIDNQSTKSCNFKRAPLIKEEIHKIIQHIWNAFDDDITLHLDINNQFWQGIASTSRALRCNIYIYCNDENEVDIIKKKNFNGRMSMGEDKKYKIFHGKLPLDSKIFDAKVTLYNKEDYDSSKENKIIVSPGYRYHSYSIFLN